jgi:hypothetical protein
MKRMRTAAYSDSATTESDVENSYNTDNEVESSEVGDEYGSDPWAPLKAEAAQQSLSEFEELTQSFTADGFDENEAKDNSYFLILPKLRKDLLNIYLERLSQLKRDPVHKKIMETRDVCVNDDNFDHREALEASIDKKIFILKDFSETHCLLMTLTRIMVVCV